jgi:hypothetical protein
LAKPEAKVADPEQLKALGIGITALGAAFTVRGWRDCWLARAGLLAGSSGIGALGTAIADTRS